MIINDSKNCDHVNCDDHSDDDFIMIIDNKMTLMILQIIFLIFFIKVAFSKQYSVVLIFKFF